jgi:hypothetical protein
MPLKGFRIAAVALLLLLLGAIVFRDFVFEDKLLLYKDIGSDSINFHYPYFVHLSDYLRSNGLPRWSFNVGMGQSIFPYINSLLFDPVVWLPRNLIAHALVYQHLLKVVICGFLFFRFLELRKANLAASLLGALLVSLSAYMCMGSCWTNVGNEVLCFTFVLFAVETALVTGRWLYLPLAVACSGLLTPFHLYFVAVLLVAYVLARLFVAKQGGLSSNAKLSLQLALAAVIGVGLSAFVSLDALAVMLGSPRGSGVASYANRLSSFPIFGLETPLHYGTAILRQFSNDMAGTGSYFRGWQNYLEAPAGYCGLFCLLILPQVFVGVDTRRRLVYAAFLVAVTIPILFPWFRYLFWLFQGDYYRTFSLFSVFGVVALSMTAFSRFSTLGTVNLWLLGATLLILLVVLNLPILGLQTLVIPEIRKLATLLLCGYAALLVAGRYFQRQSFASWAVVALSAVELCYFDRITVAYRPTVTKPELKERVGYNDYAVDAVRDVQGRDKGFYRITKLYSSSPAMHKGLNDALVFGFYGTTSYTSFNNINYISFLIALDAMPEAASENDTRWARGLIGRHNLLAFAGEKYVLTPDPVPFQVDPAYESIKRYDKIYLFRNKAFSPLGRFYTRYIPESDFMQSSTTAKESILQHAAVLGKDESAAADDLTELAPESSSADEASGALELRSFNENRIVGEIECDSTGILVLQTPFDRGWRAMVDHARAETLRVDIGLLGMKLTKGKHLVEMRYLPPFIKIGATITALALLVFVVALWRWPRISPALS